MKRDEVDESMMKYRKGVEAWGEIQGDIEASLKAAAGLPHPLMKSSLTRLTKALKKLHQLGDVLACVPGLAQSVMEEKEVSRQLRKEAERRGVILRYD